MINYFVYLVVFFILAFVIIISIKTINRELEFKKKKKYFLNDKQNFNVENNHSLADEIKELKKLYNEGLINDKEFQKVKKKILK
tara:strand:- start:770 stop:1021 length:252 start_codon:yes stop_codon:yes gene_type:complete